MFLCRLWTSCHELLLIKKRWLPGSGGSVVPILHASNSSVNLAAEFIQLKKLTKQKPTKLGLFYIYMFKKKKKKKLKLFVNVLIIFQLHYKEILSAVISTILSQWFLERLISWKHQQTATLLSQKIHQRILDIGFHWPRTDYHPVFILTLHFYVVNRQGQARRGKSQFLCLFSFSF